jgi:hypothetical protein
MAHVPVVAMCAGQSPDCLDLDANELSRYESGLLAGAIVTIGACIVPLDIAPGD